MTLLIPHRLEQKLRDQAQQRNVSVETLVTEALDWYLQLGSNILDEFTAWQEVRDETLRIVEQNAI